MMYLMKLYYKGSYDLYMRKNEPYVVYEPFLYSSLINYTKPRLRPPMHIIIRFTRFTPFISPEVRIAKHIFGKNQRIHLWKKGKNLIIRVAGGSLSVASRELHGQSVNAEYGGGCSGG